MKISFNKLNKSNFLKSANKNVFFKNEFMAFSNLSPLKKDVVSFKGKNNSAKTSSLEESSFEEIQTIEETKRTRDKIKENLTDEKIKYFSNEGKKAIKALLISLDTKKAQLSYNQFNEILNNFGYFHNGCNGDTKWENAYGYTLTEKQRGKNENVDPNAVQKLMLALSNLDFYNGELILPKTYAGEESVVVFDENGEKRTKKEIEISGITALEQTSFYDCHRKERIAIRRKDYATDVEYQKAVNEKLNNKEYLKYDNKYRKAFEEIKASKEKESASASGFDSTIDYTKISIQKRIKDEIQSFKDEVFEDIRATEEMFSTMERQIRSLDGSISDEDIAQFKNIIEELYNMQKLQYQENKTEEENENLLLNAKNKMEKIQNSLLDLFTEIEEKGTKETKEYTVYVVNQPVSLKRTPENIQGKSVVVSEDSMDTLEQAIKTRKKRVVLDDIQRQEIIKEALKGASSLELAEKYNVSRSTIYKIINSSKEENSISKEEQIEFIRKTTYELRKVNKPSVYEVKVLSRSATSKIKKIEENYSIQEYATEINALYRIVQKAKEVASELEKIHISKEEFDEIKEFSFNCENASEEELTSASKVVKEKFKPLISRYQKCNFELNQIRQEYRALVTELIKKTGDVNF